MGGRRKSPGGLASESGKGGKGEGKSYSRKKRRTQMHGKEALSRQRDVF